MRLEITRKSDLALRALRELDIAQERLRAKQLAERLSSSAQFIPQVMSPLVRAGWVDSGTGPTGGYQLMIDVEDHSVLELIELVEGATDSGKCVLRDGPCSGAELCSLHESWTAAREALMEQLRQTPIGRGNGRRT